jgi:hypothetical protein
MANKKVTETPAEVVEEVSSEDALAAAQATINTLMAQLAEANKPAENVPEDEQAELNGITFDGTDKKQGEKVIVKAFGVTVETNY